MLKKAINTYFLKNKHYLVLFFLIFIGSFLWSLTIIKSGWMYQYGLGFWGANGHDGIWHIALINNLSNLNFSNPVFSGSLIQNYHLGFDLLLSIIHRITLIPVSILYFQVMPLLFALLIGYLTYVFVSEWTKSKYSALFSVFFVYFGGSASWILNKGESAFWSQQAISTLINPPFALSLVFILTGLILLQRKKIFLSILLFGLLIQVKVYAGVLILGGLFVGALYQFFTKQGFYFLKVFLGSFFISLIIFLPFNLNPQSLIEWQPFWFLETMMSYSDRIGWQRFYSAMTTYKMGNLLFKEATFYGLALLIFVLGNFWTRILFIKDLFKKLDSFKVMFISIIAAGVFIPMLFVQSGTPWNTIQFLYYSLFFAGLLAGITVSHFGAAVCILIVLMTIPTAYLTLKDVYIPSRPPAMLSVYEVEALDFLRNQPSGVVLTYPFDKDKAIEAISNPPRPLYLYDSTAYVSAFSKKPVFLEDEVNLNIMGYDWKSRRKEVELWYKEPNEEAARKFLSDNNIKYIYWLKPQRALLGESQLGLVKIFENKVGMIFSVGK
ncbi:hypothetical protein KBD45_05310 [Candidatus Dojkabacteria bacterium]|nr:hypothetical protein [Candidatus Dojkabacteria bacterium]